MSTTITRGTTLGGVITRQDLWNLIADSQLAGVDSTALSADAKARIVTTATDQPATLVNSQLWWDMREQLLRAFDANTSLALAVGPDRFEMPAKAGYPVNRGMVVCIDGPATYSLHGNVVGIPVVRPPANSVDGIHALGIASASAASGAYFPVAYHGIVPAIFGASLYQPYVINEAVVVASGYTGMVGVAPATTPATLTWAIGNLLELPKTTIASNYSMCLFIRYCGPWKGRRYWV